MKFRVWDKVSCKWLVKPTTKDAYLNNQGFLLFINPDGYGGLNTDFYSKKSMRHLEISRSSGLKDNRNKEIFSGDIFHYGDCNFLVTFCKYTARFIITNLNIDKDFDFVDMEDWGDVRIIGNKFENPELLK